MLGIFRAVIGLSNNIVANRIQPLNGRTHQSNSKHLLDSSPNTSHLYLEKTFKLTQRRYLHHPDRTSYGTLFHPGRATDSPVEHCVSSSTRWAAATARACEAGSWALVNLLMAHRSGVDIASWQIGDWVSQPRSLLAHHVGNQPLLAGQGFHATWPKTPSELL